MAKENAKGTPGETKSDVFILTLQQQVVFPGIRTSVTVPYPIFTELCEFCEKRDSTQIGVIAVKRTVEGEKELFNVGTYCRIASHAQSTAKQGDKELTLITLSLEGQSRFQVESYKQTRPFHVANIKLLVEEMAGSPEVKALVQSVQGMVSDLLKEQTPQGGQSGTGGLKSIFGNSKRFRWPASPSVLADMIAAGLSQLSMAERQQVLEMVNVQKRLQLVLDLLSKEVDVQKLSREITSKMRKRTENELRETVLRRQMSELQKEVRRLKRGKDDTEGGEASGPGEDEEAEEEEDDITALRESLRKAQLSEDARKNANRELKRLQNIQPQHPEYTVCRTYLETLASLPWNVSTQDDGDLSKASEILDKEHYGLDKVKRRILEFLAVQKLRGDMKGPILCLHGPPGVGKTSLGKSVARALGRKFHRIALGGVRDEAELRGHRRTYIGSMPGAIISALQSMKVNNPVILLDEVDKLTKNAMFNPSGAMLELLDPEQNNTFKDHYLNTPFDLSKVLFLCTCNDLQTIDRPLLDRMEVIDLSGYTVEEKMHIATTHLLPKQRKLHALERGDEEKDSEAEPKADAAESASEPAPEEEPSTPTPVAALPEEPLLSMSKAAITDLISKWTMESGVRSLERRLSQICRWAALRLEGSTISETDREAEVALAECGPDKDGRVWVDAQHLPHIVGAELFEPDLAERLSVGVSMGLGVTSVGGSLLFVEATRSKGGKGLTITGQLGEVMSESVKIAMSLLRSKIYYAAVAVNGETGPVVRVGRSEAVASGRANPPPADQGEKFREVFQHLLAHADPTKDPFGQDDIHVHFPAGAIPKDGPSAGVTTTLALASLLLNTPVRSDTAVTGEVTLRGHVLPVGGIRDKVLAARRAGVRHVLLPYGNQRHAKDELSDEALGDVELHFVKHIDEALAWAFAENVKPLTLESSEATLALPSPGDVPVSKL